MRKTLLCLKLFSLLLLASFYSRADCLPDATGKNFTGLCTPGVTITEEEVIDAMRMVWERMKLIVEPSCSITLAAVLKRKAQFSNKRIGLILSGGNVDLNRLPWSST